MRFHSSSMLAAVAAMALPLAATAQSAGGGQQGQQSQQFEQRQGRSTAAVGTFQGQVTQVDTAQGLVTIDSGGQSVKLNGTPAQVSAFNPGDVVALPYANYGGSLWIASGQGGQQQALNPQAYSNYGVITGSISNLDRGQGSITVMGQSFRVHPQTIEGLVPGQFVSLSYGQAQDTLWASKIQPAQGGQAPGMQGGQGGGMQGGQQGGGMQGGSQQNQ